MLNCMRTTKLLVALLRWRQCRQPDRILLQQQLLLLLLALLTQLLEGQHLNIPTTQGLYCWPYRLLDSSS
jgi:hypothetical protein